MKFLLAALLLMSGFAKAKTCSDKVKLTEISELKISTSQILKEVRESEQYFINGNRHQSLLSTNLISVFQRAVVLELESIPKRFVLKPFSCTSLGSGIKNGSWIDFEFDELCPLIKLSTRRAGFDLRGFLKTQTLSSLKYNLGSFFKIDAYCD